MCAHREPPAITRWEVLSSSASQSSPSSSKGVPDLEGADLAIIGSLSKRKAILSPAGSQRHHKLARTDTSHRPERSMKATEATSRTQSAFEHRASTTSPISVKKRKVLLAPNREFLRPLPKHGSGNSRRNSALSQPRSTALGSEATQIRSQRNCKEIIEVLSSDDDTPPCGNNASNPIVLDSDDESDPILAERVSSAQPLLHASLLTPRRKNIQPRSPSGSNYFARSRASPRGPPSGVSNTGDEFRDAESPSQRAPLPPRSDMHSAQAVPSLNANVDQIPSPIIQDGSEIQDKMRNTVSENLREALPPVAFSPSSMSPKSRNKRSYDLLAVARISSSPNQGHDSSVDASADSSFVPVSRHITNGDARSKEATTTLRVNSSCNITSSTLVSMTQDMSITTSPTPSSAAGGSHPEILDDPTNTTRDSVSSAPTDDLSVIQFTPARTMLEFAPKVFFSRDIPHALQDLMNSVDTSYRQSIVAKEMFEAAIYENTYEDEPNAPRISIVNDVDGDLEVTPAWEFHYSNRIWHSEGVPLPDYTNLRGCNCEGYCDPNSQTCSCLKRQEAYSGEFLPGFIYDDKRRLRQQRFPIFECNELCGCLDGCRNRVVQHGRQYTVNIRKTTNKGWGVFAGKQKIPKGSFIGVYAGELLTEDEGEERGIKYNKFGRTYLFQIDFYHLRPSKNPNESSVSDADDDDEWQTKYLMDAYHAGNFTRFLNHSCDPNCAMSACYINEANLDKPLLALFTRRDVLPWEELCFSYSGYDSDEEDDEHHQHDNNGDAVFASCLCGAKKCKGYMFK